MFRFERRAAVKHVADMPAAVQFVAEVTAYLNKSRGLWVDGSFHDTIVSFVG